MLLVYRRASRHQIPNKTLAKRCIWRITSAAVLMLSCLFPLAILKLRQSSAQIILTPTRGLMSCPLPRSELVPVVHFVRVRCLSIPMRSLMNIHLGRARGCGEEDTRYRGTGSLESCFLGAWNAAVVPNYCSTHVQSVTVQ